jgi:hypothetical protein
VAYIVAFTMVLIMYKIYYNWIHSSSALLHTPPLIPGTVSTGIIFAFTYMCMHYLHHIHPPIPFPATSPLPRVSTLPHTHSFRIYSVLLLSNFIKEKTKDKKKNMTFLLVWDKYSCTGSFFVLFPCIYVLQPQLVHLP